MYRLKPCVILFIVSLLFTPHIIFGQQILYSDTFTGVNGQRPTNWTIVNAPDPAYWYIMDGQFCTGNGDNLLVQGGYSFAVINIAGSDQWMNYSIESTAWMQQRNGSILFVGRWQDVNNFYAGVLECYEGKRALKIVRFKDGQQVLLTRVVDGEDATVPAIENGSSPMDSKTFRLAFLNDEITFTYENVTIKANDTSFQRGSAGFGGWYNLIYFDNLLIKDLTGVSEVPPPVATSASVSPGISVVQQGVPVIPETANFQLVVAKGVSQEIANNMRDQLVSWGYIPVNIQQVGNQYNVMIGAFLTREEANRSKELLEKEGLIVYDIVSAGSAVETAVTTVSTITEQRVYRALIGEFADEASARELKSQMENEGFVAVEIVQQDGKYPVYVGSFQQESEAQKFIDYLKNEGYLFAKLVFTRAEKPTIDIASVPEPISPGIIPGTPATVVTPPIDIANLPQYQALTPEERARVEDYIRRDMAYRGEGSQLAQELEQIRAQFKQFSDEQKTIVQTIRQKVEEQEEMKRRISSLFMDVDRAIDAQQWNKALDLLAQVREIDPTNARIELKERAIEMGQKNIKFSGQDFLQEKLQKEIQEHKSAAQQYESEGNFALAINQWEQVKIKSDINSIDYNEATRKIGEMRAKLQEKGRQEEAKSRRLVLVGYVAIGLIVVMLAALLMIMMRTRKRDQELLRQVQEIALKPMLELGQGQQLGLPEKSSVPVVEEQKATPEPASPTPQPAAQEKPKVEPRPIPEQKAATAFSDLFQLEPEKEEEVAPSAPASNNDFLSSFSDSVAVESDKTREEEGGLEMPLGDLSSLFAEQEAPTETKQEKPPRKEEVVIGDIDALFDEGGVEEKAPEVAKASVEIPDIISLDDLGVEEPLKPGGAPKTEENQEEESSLEIPITEAISPPVVEKKPAPEPIKPEPIVEAPKKESVATQKPQPRQEPIKDKPSQEPVKPSKAAEDITVVSTPVPSEKIPVETEPEIQPEKPVKAFGEQKIFEQSFDDEAANQPPKGWIGSYDYASLKVVEETPAANSKRCLKFEKKTGSGSAYYYCRFPDVTGTVQIDFDLRCDEKNKYLLGVYMEKDGDFRQSIHTIIHRTEAQTTPSLRIHGEPIPYTFGSWVHVKYIIDLNEGTLDGYVNDAQVSSRVHLASNPKRLNTISIRDNLATTGILKIDNIRILKI